MPEMVQCHYDGCKYAGSREELKIHTILMDARGLHESQISDDPQPFCIGCIKTPEELIEYTTFGSEAKMTPSDFVRFEEGTYNRENGHFLCTDCYIKAGSPSSNQGWKAP